MLRALPGGVRGLPADAVHILRLIPGIDHRMFTSLGNPAEARARDHWKSWMASLQQNYDAPMPTFEDDGASVKPVHRVA
jgi:hypothetical protein